VRRERRRRRPHPRRARTGRWHRARKHWLLICICAGCWRLPHGHGPRAIRTRRVRPWGRRSEPSQFTFSPKKFGGRTRTSGSRVETRD
jgi:hypothetical protein